MSSSFNSTKMSQKKSKMWQYFKRNSRQEAECLKCHKVLKTIGGSTSGMRSHIFKKHRDEIHIDDTNITLTACKSSIIAIAKLACEDGLSFQQIANSKFIRANLSTYAYDETTPTTAAAVKNIVYNYYLSKKTEQAEYFKRQTEAGTRYSISIDSYKASQSLKYISINVHDIAKYWSLGLVPIQCEITSEKLTEIVKKRLGEFHIDLEHHIVGVTTDNSETMIEFGKSHRFLHQSCLANEIHLSICDVFYKNSQLQHDIKDETDIDEDVLEIQDWDDFEIPLVLETISDSVKTHNSDYEGPIPELAIDLALKVRKMCKILQKSPLVSDYLQEMVKTTLGQDLELIIDNPTNWNSTVTMISRFVQLKDCIRNALSFYEINEIISDEEWKLLENLVNIFRPFQIVVNGFSCGNASLMKGENSIKFILRELAAHDSALAKHLKNKLYERYSACRIANVIGLISYLENPECLKTNISEYNHPLLLPNFNNIMELAEETYNRLFLPDSKERIIKVEIMDIEATDDQHDPMLKRYVEEVSKKVEFKGVNSYKFSLANEMKHFEITGVPTERLEKLYQSLNTIRAATVRAERTFSCNFDCKIKTRLSPKTLDMFFFLNSYFKQLSSE